MAYGIVYVFTNPFNQKKYVGQTTRSIYDRARPSGYNQEFAAALQDLGGIEEFGYEQYECDSKLMLNFLESKLIREYQSYLPAYGYNQNKGMRPVICVETKEVFPNVAACEREIESFHSLYNHLVRKDPPTLEDLHYEYASEEEIHYFLEHPELSNSTSKLLARKRQREQFLYTPRKINELLTFLETAGDPDLYSPIDEARKQIRIIDAKIKELFQET